MSIAMRVYVTSDLSEREAAVRRRGLTRSPNMTMHLIPLIAFLSFLIGFGGCAGTTTKSEITLPPSEKLDQYLQTADHLTEKQKKDMAARRPFIGMTIDEANLAMRQESTKLVLSGKAMQAVYVGESGVRYNIYFQGDPLRVADWSYFSEDQMELLDPDKLRPTPPVRTF